MFPVIRVRSLQQIIDFVLQKIIDLVVFLLILH